MAPPRAPFGAGRRAGPAKAAGIALRLEPAGNGEGPWPQPRPERGFREAFRLAGFLGSRRLRPETFERATGEVSASMRALEKARLRPGRIRRESVSGPTASRRDPPGPERGLAASLRGPRKAKRAFAPASQSESRPARDGLATQRRQSKLGQVGAGGDAGPHYDSGRRRDRRQATNRPRRFSAEGL